MADTKISALTSGNPALTTDEIPIARSGANFKITAGSVASLAVAGSTTQVQFNDAGALAGNAGFTFNKTTIGLGLTSTDAGASGAPTLELYRDSASPAAADTLGEIFFYGEDSVGNKQAYARVHAAIASPTSGAETGQMHIETSTAGALTEKLIVGTGTLLINGIAADYDVRIDGDTQQSLFHTDASTDRVGIGTATPSARLDVIGSGVRVQAAATQDAVLLEGRAGGTSSYAVTLTPTTLSANRTLTLPNVTDTVATIGTAQTFTAAQTFRAADAIRSEAASTQDAVVIAGRAGGTSSYAVTLTPATLSASRTLTLPDPGSNQTLGYINAPQSSSTTLVITDQGKHVYFTGGSTATLSVPTNASVAFPVGTTILVVNNNSGNLTIQNATSGVSFQLANGASATTRTLATKGMATLLYVGSDLWYVSGAGAT